MWIHIYHIYSWIYTDSGCLMRRTNVVYPSIRHKTSFVSPKNSRNRRSSRRHEKRQNNVEPEICRRRNAIWIWMMPILQHSVLSHENIIWLGRACRRNDDMRFCMFILNCCARCCLMNIIWLVGWYGGTCWYLLWDGILFDSICQFANCWFDFICDGGGWKLKVQA